MDWFDSFGNLDNNLFYLASKESSLSDSNYRYKISNPIITTTGKKGNRTTWFENSEYFGEKLGCPSIYFGKYIGNKISCPSNFDKDKKCISWKGEYDQQTIQTYLNDFIRIYVLCPDCDYPETIQSVDSKKFIWLECKSCGNSFQISNKYIDKTYEFISKNINVKR
jgi:translation initiation factor 5